MVGGRPALIRSEIDRGEFDGEKSAYWQARFRKFSKSELESIYSK